MTPTLYLLLNAPGGDETWFEGLLRWLMEGPPRAGAGSTRSARLAAVVFTFMGLAVEVRHVTLSAASLALCAAQAISGPGPMPWAALAWGLAGIALIGLLNFGVSFALALRTAIGARNVDRRGREGLRRLLWSTFRSHPWHFLGPPAENLQD